jgi:predicted secreted protein with PEFG-CTERM motif
VNLVSTAPTKDEGMLIKVAFTDSQGMPIENVNYGITAIQDGASVLSESKANAADGEAEYSTNALGSADPVDIQVTVLGIGLAGDEASWSGPKDATIPIHVTPEFGPLSMVIFGIAIVSIVAVATKSRIIPKAF